MCRLAVERVEAAVLRIFLLSLVPRPSRPPLTSSAASSFSPSLSAIRGSSVLSVLSSIRRLCRLAATTAFTATFPPHLFQPATRPSGSFSTAWRISRGFSTLKTPRRKRRQIENHMLRFFIACGRSFSLSLSLSLIFSLHLSLFFLPSFSFSRALFPATRDLRRLGKT